MVYFRLLSLTGGVGFEVETDWDGVVNELVAERTEFGGVRISMFSEGEEEEDYWMSEEVGGDYLLEDGEFEEQDSYF